jgi:hypothetical protein
MKTGHIALGLIIISLSFAAMAFLTGCKTLGSSQVCMKTEYGTFCYQLPELPKPTSSK